MKAFIIPLVFYFMALMGLCVEFLPEPALAIFGGKPEGDARAMTVAFVIGFGGIGAMLHWWLYRRDPDRFDSELMLKVGGCMAMVLAGLFCVSAVLSISTGEPPEQLARSTSELTSTVGIFVIGGMLLLLIGAAVAMYLALRFHPLNRMSRQLQAENYPAAIAIGERAIRKSDDAAIRFNLALAYAADGRVEQTRSIYIELAAMKRPPEPFTEETFAEAVEQLRKELERSGSERQRVSAHE